MERTLINPSVRRCLFGRPESDEFTSTQKRWEAAEERRFKRKWLENDAFEWTPLANADTCPEYYRRGFSHKCKRRVVRPCVGRSLSFANSDNEQDSDDAPPSPVQFCESSTVEVFIGVGLRLPQEPDTPIKSQKRDFEDSPKENTDTSVASEVSSFPAQLLRRNFTQRRLTDMWRILKKRQSERASLNLSQPSAKRAKLTHRV